MGNESRGRRRRAATPPGEAEVRQSTNGRDVPRATAHFREVTGRKGTRQALVESERSFRALADSIPQLAWMADATGWIFWYNARWYDYTGTTLEEMQGWGWQKVHHPEHVDRVVERIRHAFETGEPWEDTFPLRSQAGEYRWFLSRALPIKDAAGNVIRWFGTNTDVTEQLAAAAEREQLLERERQAREQVTTILESITDAFFALDREWRFTYVNTEAERVLQRPRATLLGQGIWQEFREAVGTTFFREYHRAMTERITTEFVEFFAPLDTWFEVRAYPSPEGLSVYFHDVTERIRAGDALRESEERFRALAENATAAIFVIDEESRVEFANPAMERIFGYTVDEMLGQSLERLMPENQRPLHRAGMQRYLATGRRKIRWEGVELPGLTKDGRIIPLVISFGEYTRRGRRYFTGIARDITDRKRAEQALRDSEARYRLLADMIPQNIWTTDAAGYHTYFSRRWYEYSGTTHEESRGEGWLRFIHPEDKERTIARWRHSLETGEPYEIEYRFRGTDGVYRWFLGKATPLRNEAGQIVEWFGTATDISERKRLEEERERLLGQEQEARAEAERRRDELERVTESRARLIRGFSHDVKNPLGAADGYLHLMGLMNHLTEPQKEKVGKVRRSIKAALTLIEDLLELARAEAGEIEIQPAPTDVRAVAEEAVEEYRAQAEAQRLSLTIGIQRTPPAIDSDARRIRQILGNLLSNAVKYTERGAVTVAVDVREGGKAPGPGRWIAIDVADTGPGIPEEQQSLLFQEFRRLGTAVDTKGAGIGLAISRRIAQALGGDITATSVVGAGSTFTLWLPTRSERRDEHPARET